ncbi:replication restart DNA helicase PriA [Desulfurella multipotens]|uniref:Replication restart protein PriA n=1 Tax=Desulfurella multipotens TaxID=79269 RepID=A0A1G6QFP8_9BACT|nr:primosomal protein N' [Desulfurella multipotens]SDC90516.1 replication restart DNA helicase PriA [Desulfurella multipotens]
MNYYNVLFNIALSKSFTYKSTQNIEVGSRVLVDFNNRKKVGIVLEKTTQINIDDIKEIKEIISILDNKPVITEELIKTINFASYYYLSPRGLILRNALPSKAFSKEPINFEKNSIKKQINHQKFFNLNDEQKKIYESIDLKIFNVNLIFGVTGSGKTEIFLHLIRDVIEKGKNALVLVPEIVLTNQYKRVFEEKFLDTVGVYHSQLTPKQKFLEWLMFKKQEKRVLLGTRSAAFVDLSDTGLIVIDEENDDSYKQENTPSYNAKDLLIYRAKQLNIPVILSSATPTVETYYKASITKKFKLFKLNNRINNCELPVIEFSKPENTLLSIKSQEYIKKSIEEKQTCAILVNRRGFAHFLICGDCGYIFRCPNCNVSLVYHKKTKDLKCHFCESSFEIPKKCPNCSSYNIKDVGTGTQKMEEFLRENFGNINIARLDRDTASSKKNAYNIVSNLLDGKIDIIVGTSMISKGYDIEKINLVIISNIESIFALPDFRADEKCVSLIIQTAGRSGRKQKGNVIIESKLPSRLENFIINHDYEGFLKEEINLRKSLNYPPFSHLIRILSQNTNEKVAKQNIQLCFEILKNSGFSFLGPTKCPIDKIKNKYRYHIIIKTNDIFKTLHFITAELLDKNLNFDVDPISFF